jgi:DUF971 family protein
MKPRNVTVVNDILAIAWEDGHESYYDLDLLRRACPCAVCKGEASVLVESRPPPPKLTPASFRLRGWQFVGGYAIQPHWADSHASGIYSFQYLRDLCNCEQCAAARQSRRDS